MNRPWHVGFQHCGWDGDLPVAIVVAVGDRGIPILDHEDGVRNGDSCGAAIECTNRSKRAAALGLPPLQQVPVAVRSARAGNNFRHAVAVEIDCLRSAGDYAAAIARIS